MQIDMGRVLTVAGTVLQGRKDLNQYVSTYTVATSVDGKNFTNVTGEYNGKRGTVKNLFTDGSTIKARYVRIYVKTFESHPSTRAAVLVTESAISEEKPAVTGVPLYYSDAPESARTYSGIWENQKPGVGHGRSCLNGPQGWSALHKKAGEWMQIDMGQVCTVAGTVVQHRKDYSPVQYVKTYTVATSVDGKNFTNVTGTYNGKNGTVKNQFVSGGTVKARYVRLYVKSWQLHPSMRADVLITDEINTAGVPAVPLYYSNPPESARTYSSIWENNKPGVRHGRSCLDGPQGWSALHKKAGEWMQIDMGKVQTVAGTVLQGRKDMAQYLKTYTVATSVCGTNFSNVTGTYSGQRGTAKNLFTGCSGATIKARYVRIYVKTFQSHPSTRAAVLVTESGKSAGVSIPGIPARTTQSAGIDTGKAAVPRKDRPSADMNTGKPAVADVHRRPAGINTPGKPATGGKPPEKITRAGVPEGARVYSSIYANDKPGVGHGRSCLDSPQAWSALNNVVGEWMQLDLGEEKTVAGIAIQPRKDLVTGVQQYVKTYTVSTSHDGTSFTNITGVYNGHQAQTIVDNVFPECVRPRARYVRIYPQSWNSHMSLRCDVLISDLKPPNSAGQQGISVYGLGKRLTIENKNATGKFLSITNIGADDTGASLVLWDNPTDLATQWYIMDIGNGQYNILNAKSLKCVNVSRHRMNFGANVLQWDNPKSPETRFSIKTLNGGAIAIDEAVTIESCYNSGKYINAIFGHKDNGTQLLLMGEVGNWATQWIIRVANDSGTSSRL